jgi:two-component system chemotaxis sensor kinase CheA
LDTDNPSLEDLNAIFRAAHSIKGGSGTFGFTDMTEVTHILETLLDRLRKSELALRPEMVDAFLSAGDVLRGQLEHHQGGPEVDPNEVARTCERLGALALDTQARASEPEVGPPREIREMMLECVLPPALAVDVRGVENLLASLADIAACDVRHTPDASDPSLRVQLSSASRDDEIKDIFSFHLTSEEIRLHPLLEEEAFGVFDGAPGAPEMAYGFFEPLDAELAPVESYGFFEQAPGAPTSPTEAVTGNVIEENGFGVFADAPGSEHAVEAITNPQVDQPSKSPGRRASDNTDVDRATSGRRTTDKVVVGGGETSSIRVSVEKVDQLINLVGELVITQAMIADAAGYLDPVQAEKLLSGIDLLARNTRDLQESVMSIRMLPMSMVFSRFPRVIRDLAGKLGKQVE